MKEYRSASQILFGFLPEQTVDLQGRVWKVREWRNPLRKNIDSNRLRRELVRQAMAWAATRMDGDYVMELQKGREVKVLSLNREDGISVDSYPPVWMCKVCHRIQDSSSRTCQCRSKRFGQLPFVGYHDKCGALRIPYIPRCPEHGQVRVELPGTSSAAELEFQCPICHKLLRKGFGTPSCDCGKGNMVFTVHRSAAVYTPRTLVIVNPPSVERHRRILQADGPSRALSWVLSGLTASGIDTALMTRSEFSNLLRGSGLSESLVSNAVAEAISSGRVIEDNPELALDSARREEAEEQAVTVAIALNESRIRLEDLLQGTTQDSSRFVLYNEKYPRVFSRCGIEAVELVDKFPVLTGSFGYTRGGSSPGDSRLVPFRTPHYEYAVYADISETEALFIRLRASAVAFWLQSQGFEIGAWTDEPSARLAILNAAVLPQVGSTPGEDSAGKALLTLVHSFAHRFIRVLAVHAGIDRNALSELLVPLHCGFFVYAAARGDFVLGGLQAVFETELERMLNDFIGGDHRCALDPGCSRAGGACMACLHLGEPSCRYYNCFLDRSVLSGVSGYLRLGGISAAVDS